MDIMESLLKERKEDDPSTYMEQTIIKTAIEFCLNIEALDYLFQDVYDFFFDKFLNEEFVKCLEPFIMTGKFKKCIIPMNLVRKLVYLHEEK
mgnify:CR=1 FL=1